MHSQRAASAFGQYLEITTRLRGFHYSESIFLARDRNIGGVIAGDLKKYARVWAALVGLSSRVQKTRPEAEARCHMLRIADCMTNLLQPRLVINIHLDVAEDGKIVSLANASEMNAKVIFQRVLVSQRAGILRIGEQLNSVLFENRFFRGKRAGLFVFAGQLFSFDFAGLNVRLIKSIDADDRPGHGSSNFPAEELLTDIVSVRHCNANDGLPSVFERSNLLVLVRVGSAFEPKISEDAIVAIII